jgi:hypothetical protein
MTLSHRWARHQIFLSHVPIKKEANKQSSVVLSNLNTLKPQSLAVYGRMPPHLARWIPQVLPAVPLQDGIGAGGRAGRHLRDEERQPVFCDAIGRSASPGHCRILCWFQIYKMHLKKLLQKKRHVRCKSKFSLFFVITFFRFVLSQGV